MRISGCFALVLSPIVTSFKLELTVNFPEGQLSQRWFAAGNEDIFCLNYAGCANEALFGIDPLCPGLSAPITPGGCLTHANLVAENTWRKTFDLGDAFFGKLELDLYAPQSIGVGDSPATGGLVGTSSVTACTAKAAFEMQLEMCQQQGNPWTVSVAEPTADTVALNIFPSFGFETGSTSVLLPKFYSPQLNNSRDIPVYVPPSLLQNPLPRPGLNVMVLLDGTEATVASFATRGGFEAAQAAGDAPESIMVGISTIDFVYESLDFDQRTYELTYAEADADPNKNCISGNFSHGTGGTDLLLEWIVNDVLPAVLANLSSTKTEEDDDDSSNRRQSISGHSLGEVSIAGGSLGGLSSCYAASKMPLVFQRALCMSPSNCFNWAQGGLAPVIAANYAAAGNVAPKFVMQVFGAEVYSGNPSSWSSDEVEGGPFTQEDFMVLEEAAWRDSAGLTPLRWGPQVVSTPPNQTAQEAAATKGEYRAPYGYSTLPLVSDGDKDGGGGGILSLILPGGQHSPGTWQREFSTALKYMYRRGGWPEANREPISAALKYLSVGV